MGMDSLAWATLAAEQAKKTEKRRYTVQVHCVDSGEMTFGLSLWATSDGAAVLQAQEHLSDAALIMGWPEVLSKADCDGNGQWDATHDPGGDPTLGRNYGESYSTEHSVMDEEGRPYL